MSFGGYVLDHLPGLLLDAYQHASAVAQSVAVAAVIGVLIGIAVYRGALRSAITAAAASAILTIPSFALIGVLIPVFGLGVTPTVITLVLYALLPIIRNTIVGLDSVDPAAVGAAEGIGMSRIQVLTMVELRLAWPSILAGLRVATQLLMGIAAIAAYAKGPGLGLHIFSGLAQIGSANAINNVAAGTLGIVILALLLDGVYLLIARLTVPRGIRDTDR
ncbi:ABC transporter permease [Pseudonocardia spinosispora]|uniref:ABC transporter permease n=1 Tax=Pseudonocardia spinosispora TaxID=103441 RepID=UPI000418AF67|nr:ABC transporter permease [Pseudonocardia spinosispora]